MLQETHWNLISSERFSKRAFNWSHVMTLNGIFFCWFQSIENIISVEHKWSWISRGAHCNCLLTMPIEHSSIVVTPVAANLLDLINWKTWWASIFRVAWPWFNACSWLKSTFPKPEKNTNEMSVSLDRNNRGLTSKR